MSRKEYKTPVIQASASPALAAAVRVAADRDMMSISEYVRRAVLDRLRWQGVDPAAFAKEARHAQ